MNTVTIVVGLAIGISFALYNRGGQKPAQSQEEINEAYIKVLEAVAVKQRNELFERGYATDDTVFIAPYKETRDLSVKTYEHITGKKINSTKAE